MITKTIAAAQVRTDRFTLRDAYASVTLMRKGKNLLDSPDLSIRKQDGLAPRRSIFDDAPDHPYFRRETASAAAALISAPAKA
jgi:hypothetical protein